MFTIAVDIYGGDLGPRVALRACHVVLKKHRQLKMLIPMLNTDSHYATQLLTRYSERIELIPCTHAIVNNLPIREVLHGASNSSMFICLDAYAKGRVSGVLSSGNTAALLMLSKRLIGALPNVTRPALARQLPTRSKPLLMLDLGANLSATSEQLITWSLLATAWYRARGISQPKLALLNVGVEQTKGPSHVRDAATTLSQIIPECYGGFAEGYGLFDGDLDALVCDGFSGNVALKTIEGLAGWLTGMVREDMRRSLSMRWFIPLWRHTFKKLHRRISPTVQGGALLLGLDGIVVKTHGNSDQRTFQCAIGYLLEQIQQQSREEFKKEYKQLLHRYQQLGQQQEVL